MRTIIDKLKSLPLAQQLALTAAGCCLLATMALVGVTARSNQFVQEALLTEYGEAVAQQLARQLASELMSNDRLGMAAEVNRVVELAAISRATATGVEGTVFAEAGASAPGTLTFRANIPIDGNIAGQVQVDVTTDRQAQARRQLILALAGLGAVLSIGIYGITLPMGKRLGRQIDTITDQFAEVTDSDIQASSNEVARLQDRAAALPLELLRPSPVAQGNDSHYNETAVLYIALKSLPSYVDTLDAPRLQRYVTLAHRLAYGAAGFYGGELYVVRQFGLAVYFSDQHKIGSPALRAASCGWLMQHSAAPAEETIRLSLRQGLAIGTSELGRGDGRDIYPGLYIQSTLDELRDLAESDADALLVTDRAARDVDLTTRMKMATFQDGAHGIDDVADGHRDLLERQLHIMLGAILPEAKAVEPPAGGLSINH